MIQYDIFITSLDSIPKIDLIIYYIPTIIGAKPTTITIGLRIEKEKVFE